ncbi:MAG: hypothetical protein LBI18_13595 [Planctomycetaceae bacterium]|jgi:hypothetical protein|nr:hypothetical protein [Planctomycetaceae bacterium]
MSTTTDNLSDSNDLTFEKVLQLIRENSKEVREIFAETDRRMQETDRRIQETDRQMQKTDKQIKRLGKQFGDLSNRFGELAEHLVAPGIARVFNELGYHFYQVSSDIEIKDDNNKTLIEIDLLLDNDETMVAVEVKSKPKEKDIPHHINRLRILREHIQKHTKENKKIIGAIAGAIFDKEIKANAIEAGFYTITQSGDTLKLDVPADFQPRLF